MTTLGNIIRSKRTNLGITQEQLARKTELSRNYITQVENGAKIPSDKTVELIATALGIKSGDLFSNRLFEKIRQTYSIDEIKTLKRDLDEYLSRHMGQK